MEMYDRGGDVNAEDATDQRHTVADKAAMSAGGRALEWLLGKQARWMR